ncbi:copper chaperone PCu(A)C [Teichococcus vastitatis]|uniref:Copper chaperone PCu(A)C n=1 Tax=Teichococcus vastitatis TaxID=2307076 RepID=A0ABS9W3V1_9PROT|nr:copper chaperone PCu(A)C [Pseudoroseomonas vastitatis]MCI0753957.1 copper chaperone PCu(A)C [Pseudoroseomonas vastitatis]
MLHRRHLPVALALLGLATAAHAQAHDYRQGDIAIGHPWSRAAPARITGAGFMTLRNTGGVPDRLLSASAEIATSTEIHSHVRDGEMMRMRAVEGGIPLSPGEEVALSPGGYHLMLIGLKRAMARGERVPVTLTFERAGSITVELAVAAAGAPAPGAGGHNH